MADNVCCTGGKNEERESRGEEGGEMEEGKEEKSLRKRLQVFLLGPVSKGGIWGCSSVCCMPIWHSHRTQRPEIQEEMQSVNRHEVTITLAPTYITRMRTHAREAGVAGK